jgi:thermitase
MTTRSLKQKIYRGSAWALLLSLALNSLLPGAFVRAQEPPAPAGPGVVPENQVAPTVVPNGAQDFAPGEIVVALAFDDVTAAGAAAQLGYPVIGQTLIPAFRRGGAGVVAGAETAADEAAGIVGATLVQTWRVTPGSEWQVIAQLAQTPGVRYAEPNWWVAASAEIPVDDPLPAEGEVAAAAVPVAEQGFSFNDTIYFNRQWYAQQIQPATVNPTPTVVKVAIVDSGVDREHPDLQGVVERGANFVFNESDGDGFGHGTHGAGLVAAVGNNGKGMAGVGGAVKIYDYKALAYNGGGTIDGVVAAITAAVDDGMQILNLSLQTSNASVALQQSLQYAEAQGVLIVAAAGNNTGSVAYPGAFPESIGVAALTFQQVRAGYSNSGSALDIAAPGGDAAIAIFSTWSSNTVTNPAIFANPPVANAADRCIPPNKTAFLEGKALYCTNFGTSFAAPLVTGVAALVWSLKPSLTAKEVRAIVEASVRPLNQPQTLVGKGMLDALAAVKMLQRSRLEVSDPIVQSPLTPEAPVFTRTVRLGNDNPSPITWTMPISLPAWLSVTVHTGGALAGAVQAGRPAWLTLVVSPTGVPTSTYRQTLLFQGKRTDGSQTFANLVVLATQVVTTVKTFAPLAYGGVANWVSSAGITTTVYTLTNSSLVNVALPFAFPLGPNTTGGGSVQNPTLVATFSKVRLYADGFLAFATSDAEAPVFEPGKNRCLPDGQNNPAQAVYGWWADLDPSRPGAQVRSFQPGAGRIVFEFLNVPTAAGIVPGYVVSFQIELVSSGTVVLHYRQAPGFGFGAQATAGVDAGNGLFFNQIGCRSGNSGYGILPASGQSFTITRGDIY